MMRLLYKKVAFKLEFNGKARFLAPPAFVVRSVMGLHLRRICCIAHGSVCGSCMFSSACAYGFAFESIAPRSNEVLAGRDRFPHPVIIETEHFLPGEYDALNLNLVCMGQAVKYLPYFYYALKKAGELGVLRERVSFLIKDVVYGGASILLDRESLDTGAEPDLWEADLSSDDKPEQRELLVRADSPLRLKIDGRYVKSLEAGDFAASLFRRALALCSQYGSAGINSGGYQFSGKWHIINDNLVWRDFEHYSARQRVSMQLGGLMGDMVLSGEFTSFERALLRFAGIFHTGKNANFGLGRISVWEKGI
ncbi:CRISPR system precrRNA processing endoribonuclease RAMP protein Cas6 [Leadbettera azotonutricia]|uniref:CRISPR-associated protein Cas6 C-terminal domain-containing protein n=1 Tax=Leadbettera azotonutricia (strain ATCC BAA-888 / DSM 13862 / ZAS-9) TaxID=545695 RepID=F5YD05_LEAAZ|nr:CRISPR system precrRNA processing endoribonuclease RAMP protein Cas6 [Leadbettera azotonutricia]AEF81572.1 conserved hypothetical protein [Leadbettera azotonutricia ZAS-9]